MFIYVKIFEDKERYYGDFIIYTDRTLRTDYHSAGGPPAEETEAGQFRRTAQSET